MRHGCGSRIVDVTRVASMMQTRSNHNSSNVYECRMADARCKLCKSHARAKMDVKRVCSACRVLECIEQSSDATRYGGRQLPRLAKQHTQETRNPGLGRKSKHKHMATSRAVIPREIEDQQPTFY
jgi:hypothetical protein